MPVALGGVSSVLSSVHGGAAQSLVEFVEIAILRNAVGPEIEFLDQAQMLGQVHVWPRDRATSEMRLAAAVPVPSKGEGVGARDQAAERFVQRRARSCGTVGERSDQLYSLEVIAAQADALGGRGSANPLVPRVAEVRAACDIGQGPVDNQTALPAALRRTVPCSQCRWTSPTKRNLPALWAGAPH